MKRRFLIYLLTAVMALSPAAVFAGDGDEGETPAADPVVSDEVQDQDATDIDQDGEDAEQIDEEAAPEEPAEEPAVQEDPEEPAEVEVIPEDELEIVDSKDAKAEGETEWTNGWNTAKTQYKNASGEIQTGLFKAPKRNDPSINTMYFASADGTIRTTGGPITVTSDMTSTFYRFADKGTTSGYEEQPGEKGPLTYFVYTVDGDCDIMPKEGIYQANGAKYYIQKDGTVLTKVGFKDISGTRYYINTGGAINTKVGKFTASDGATYYVENSNGKVRTTEGFYKINDGKKYYFNTAASGKGSAIYTKEGVLVTNKAKTVRYYTYKGGKGAVKTTAGFVKIGTKKYLCKSDGSISTKAGVVTYNGKKYFANSSGSIRTKKGFVKDAAGNRYYVYKTSGLIKVNKSFKVKKKTYHAKKSGALYIGVHKWKNVLYYSTSTGALKRKVAIMRWKGNLYHIKKGSKVTVNKMVYYKGKYYIANKKGVIYTGLFTWKNNKYYASEKGVLRVSAGFITVDGSKYYVRSGGKIYRDTMFKAGGKKYRVDADGKVMTGLYKYNGTYYLTDANGAVISKKGFYTYKGKTYFNNKGGGLLTNSLFEYKDKYYYVGSDGAVVKGAFKYKGYWWNPNTKTGEISLEEYVRLHPEAAPQEEEDDDNNAA